MQGLARSCFFIGLLMVVGFIPISFFFGNIFPATLMIWLGVLGAVLMLIGGIQSVVMRGKPSPIPGKVLGWGLLAIAVIFIAALPISCTMTDTFFPQSGSYKIVVESENGDVYETDLRGKGAINRKGEFLLRYNASELASFVGLYLDSWVVSDVDNPYFVGKIKVNKSSYYSSNTIYNSANSSYQKDIYYDHNGEIVWSYEYTDPVKSKDPLFQTVNEVVPLYDGATGGNFYKYINVNQFLIQIYGIDVQTVYDRTNKHTYLYLINNS
ncbi:MAG: hypothetical protein FWG14_09055 [Peptococcaceae bacterium]|nr:hypothetical protein [Peptococcaceae bacterium]